ncbi:MAG: undecaprenyl-diphosphate phosphatase [Spirochaetales bacterium]|nr:undecaprenyl-diphosphate phosphatase [Spirochaetales bacterium]
MDLWKAIILGAVQGVAEFLPISSSGHLVVLEKLMGLDMPLAFDILLHIPTLLAVIIVFRKRLGLLLSAFFKWISKGFDAKSLEEKDQHQLKLILMMIIATAVTVVAALGLKQTGVIELQAKFVGIFFIITAIFLYMTRFLKPTKEYKDFGVKEALITGLAQGFGAIPGISRSGSSISGALAAGLKRDLAGEYAFLISIPAILGASIIEAKDMGTLNIPAVSVIGGILASFIVGLLSLLLLIRFVKNGKLYYFSFYLLPAGIATLVFV